MLEIKNVHAGYGKLKILRGINLSVPKGKFIALLGGNGTGKSTLLKTHLGAAPADGGLHRIRWSNPGQEKTP